MALLLPTAIHASMRLPPIIPFGSHRPLSYILPTLPAPPSLFLSQPSACGPPKAQAAEGIEVTQLGPLPGPKVTRQLWQENNRTHMSNLTRNGWFKRQWVRWLSCHMDASEVPLGSVEKGCHLSQ
jgi:hypothetical protein